MSGGGADPEPGLDPAINPGLDPGLNPAIDTACACAAFGAALIAAGVDVPADRVVWWAQAIAATAPSRVQDLYWLGRVTLLDNAGGLPVYDAVFGQVFRGQVDVADERGRVNQPSPQYAEPVAPQPVQSQRGNGEQHPETDQLSPAPAAPRPGEADDTGRPSGLATASALELLREKDFAQCSAEELAELAGLIDRMKVVAPRRPSRWDAARRLPHGRRPDRLGAPPTG